MGKTVGISLSGGALRGIFHLGVLQALEELEVEISVLAGTSSGSIIAVLYADGHSTDAILKIATNGSMLKMLNIHKWGGGLLSLNYLRSLLEEHLSVSHIEELNKKVVITATDFLSGEVVLFDKGPIIPPVLASSSIPIMFAPQMINDVPYVDGGLKMNLPASPIRQQCDVLLGSNLVPDIGVDLVEVSSSMKQASRTFDIVVLNNIKPELQQCDLELTMPELRRFGRFDFSRHQELIDLGRKAVESKKEAILRLMES